MITKDEAQLAAATAAIRYGLPWNGARAEARWRDGKDQTPCWVVTSASNGATAFWQDQEIDDNGCSLLIDGKSGAVIGLELQRITLSRDELEALRERRLPRGSQS